MKWYDMFYLFSFQELGENQNRLCVMLKYIVKDFEYITNASLVLV